VFPKLTKTLVMWKQVNTMQWSSCCQFQKMGLRGFSSTDRNGGTNVSVVKEPTLKEINLPSLKV